MKSLKILSKIDLVHVQQKKVELPTLHHIKSNDKDTRFHWLQLKSTNNQKLSNDRLGTLKGSASQQNKLNDLRTTLSIIGTKHIREINSQIIEQKLFESNKNIRRNLFRQQPKLTFFRDHRLHNKQESEIQKNLQPVKKNQLLLKYSSKLKLVYRNSSRNKNLVIVLSVDFILNQYYFWNQEEIYQNCTKIWKKLENIGTLIWIIRKQKSLKKLKDYAKKYFLHLDTVYILQTLKIQNYAEKILTVDYNCITDDLKLKDEKIMIITLLKNRLPIYNLMDCLQQKIPLIDYELTSFHILHCSGASHKTFSKLTTLFKSDTIHNPIDLNEIWNLYIQQIKKLYKSKETEQNQLKQIRKLVNNPQEIQDKVLLKIQKLKNQWISLFSQLKKSNLKNPSQNDSLKYIIGDLLKRNYDKFINVEMIPNISKKKPRKNLSKQNQINFSDIIQSLINKISTEYTIPTYLWDL